MVQEKYANEVVAKFGMADAKVVSTPFEPGSVLGLEESDETALHPDMVDVPYRNLVGSLMYLAVCTRLDLAMAVSSLSRLCQNLQPVIGRLGRGCCGILKGRLGRGWDTAQGKTLLYGDIVMQAMAATLRLRGGRSGFVFMSGGAAVSWGSKLQEVVALSSTESEYMAIGHAV